MKTFVIVAIFCLAAIGSATAGLSGCGKTTRYWDCCKPSCSWKENMPNGLAPVASCSNDGCTAADCSVHSGCDDGGSSYVCNNLQPWAANHSLAYGFVAASFSGGTDNSKCGVCLKLKFKGALSGKTMIVQNVNTGGDLGQNHFDIQMPGSGMGIFTKGCATQWPDIPFNNWGQQYGGVSCDSECSNLPQPLQAGCHFRFGWFQNADNPEVVFQQVKCPKEITSITGTANNDGL